MILAAILIELFTSQGCSSCPPADELLRTLGREPGVIALAFHVDYWNEIGWRDPFSAPEWSQRQRDYVRALRLSTAYTPQVVVNGQWQMVGSDRRAIREAMRNASAQKPEAHLSIDAEGRLTARSSRPLTLWVANVESAFTTSVTRGENKGRKLRNDYVVRKLTKLGTVNGTFEQRYVWDGTIVAFLQDPRTMRVYAATAK
jgi:hypothetical protein